VALVTGLREQESFSVFHRSGRRRCSWPTRRTLWFLFRANVPNISCHDPRSATPPDLTDARTHPSTASSLARSWSVLCSSPAAPNSIADGLAGKLFGTCGGVPRRADAAHNWHGVELAAVQPHQWNGGIAGDGADEALGLRGIDRWRVEWNVCRYRTMR
jgi:hypothetical protein